MKKVLTINGCKKRGLFKLNEGNQLDQIDFKPFSNFAAGAVIAIIKSLFVDN